MHLKKLPTFFVKGSQRKAAFYTVQARELEAAGWTLLGRDRTTELEPVAPVAPPTTPEPEAAQEVPQQVSETPAEEANVNLDEMTRAELVTFAEQNNIEFKSYATKAEILQACKEFANG